MQRKRCWRRTLHRQLQRRSFIGMAAIALMLERKIRDKRANYAAKNNQQNQSGTAKKVFSAHFAHYKYFYLYVLILHAITCTLWPEQTLITPTFPYLYGHHLQALSSFRLECTSDSLSQLLCLPKFLVASFQFLKPLSKNDGSAEPKSFIFLPQVPCSM